VRCQILCPALFSNGVVEFEGLCLTSAQQFLDVFCCSNFNVRISPDSGRVINGYQPALSRPYDMRSTISSCCVSWTIYICKVERRSLKHSAVSEKTSRICEPVNSGQRRVPHMTGRSVLL